MSNGQRRFERRLAERKARRELVASGQAIRIMLDSRKSRQK